MQDCKNLKTRHLHLTSMLDQSKEILNIRRVRNNNNKGSRSNVNKHELVNCESSIILLKKIKKVKDFSFIRKEPYRDIFNQIQGYSAPPLDVCLSFVLLFTIFIILLLYANGKGK